ncbi:LOW QUALITY PROTEIN: defensin-like protein 316 [Arabidopsis lyrata subsp. lyrata]|uniref:LOW QUALITY PROTEIN: defensin-like protein 316 n=1 Tax=Arabidopsis lyrata subsp. lyrata TaxID=81972 RepID=UPI000A29ABB5|nr:LOW QUALITY PROTEIN: defensin-like protein 316 [Arabidopsis lyrata subsp. lyrata]|eukprot:XP_020866099.1 LOW QUALITY PROTEIN: defensin-like protein 316 [Arabidopsis lyrata subsp. lyrata]
MDAVFEQDLKKVLKALSIRCLHASTIRLEVHITHEKVAACPRQNQRLYSCDSLRILYNYFCLTTRDLLYSKTSIN